jgi:hypothetical protein
MDLPALQNRLRDLVAEEPLLAGRPVLIEDHHNLVAIVEATLATQSLCAVISPVSGSAQDAQPRRQIHSAETFEIVIHRGVVDAPDTPSTVAVLAALRARVHGALLTPAHPAPAAAPCWRYVSHQLRELGDGAYARALVVEADALT